MQSAVCDPFDIISYALFVDADMWIYPCTTLWYHAGPKAKLDNAVISEDKFMHMIPLIVNKHQLQLEYLPLSTQKVLFSFVSLYLYQLPN